MNTIGRRTSKSTEDVAKTRGKDVQDLEETSGEGTLEADVPFPRVHHEGVKTRSGFSKAIQVGVPAAAVLAAAAGGAYYLLEHQAPNTLTEPADRSREDLSTEILFGEDGTPANREDPHGGPSSSTPADLGAREDPVAPSADSTSTPADPTTVHPSTPTTNHRNLFRRHMPVTPSVTPGAAGDSTPLDGSMITPTNPLHNNLHGN